MDLNNYKLQSKIEHQIHKTIAFKIKQIIYS